MKTPKYLNALRAFEATARLGGYQAASDEIGVTPEAIGQLVRLLETYIGTPLFYRAKTGRRLTLTPKAVAELPAISHAMLTLSESMTRLISAKGAQPLTLTAPPSIAAQWLMPHIPAFLQSNPDIDLRLDITDRLVDLPSGVADIALRYGQGDWPGLETTRLFSDERLFVVCSPALRRDNPDIVTPEGLMKQTFIRDSTITQKAYPGWTEWFAIMGFHPSEPPKTLDFNAAMIAIDAAIMGQGIALAREYLIQNALKDGRLVNLYPYNTLQTGWHYDILTRKAPSDLIRQFTTWFTQTVTQNTS